MTQPTEPLAYQSKEPASPPRLSCPKCGERMEQGLVVGMREHCWVAGEVKRNVFGSHLPRGLRYEVVTFRCVGCGLLESYSPPG